MSQAGKRQGRPPQPEESRRDQREQVMLEPRLIGQVEALARARQLTKSSMYRLLIIAGLQQLGQD